VKESLPVAQLDTEPVEQAVVKLLKELLLLREGEEEAEVEPHAEML